MELVTPAFIAETHGLSLRRVEAAIKRLGIAPRLTLNNLPYFDMADVARIGDECDRARAEESWRIGQ